MLVSALLTVLYVAIPNTRVRLRPALIGGIAAGILWAAVGRFFTLFVLYSARLTLVYAGFAIMIAALLWTYFGWTILLLGAQVSFYAQNPGYLREGLSEPRLSGADVERLALGIMYLVAERARDTGRPGAFRAGPAPGISGRCHRAHLPRAGRRGLLLTAPDARCNWRATRTQIRPIEVVLSARVRAAGPYGRRPCRRPVEAFCESSIAPARSSLLHDAARRWRSR